MAEELLCPSCGRGHPPSERFCEHCGMPLVMSERGEERHVSERRRRARKIDPRYAEGEPVKVASAVDLAQAELIAGMLLEEGIPSVIAPPHIGIYAPFAGPRAVLVPQSAAEAARELLSWTG